MRAFMPPIFDMCPTKARQWVVFYPASSPALSPELFHLSYLVPMFPLMFLSRIVSPGTYEKVAVQRANCSSLCVEIARPPICQFPWTATHACTAFFSGESAADPFCRRFAKPPSCQIARRQNWIKHTRFLPLPLDVPFVFNLFTRRASSIYLGNRASRGASDQ